MDRLELWLVRGAIAAVIALQIAMVHNFALGSRWFAPALEVALVLPMLVLSSQNHRLGSHGSITQAAAAKIESNRNTILILGLCLVAVISVANAAALLALVGALVSGGDREGKALLVDAANIWTTNVIVFALWYWELDRGGPGRYRIGQPPPSDFIFPQMTLGPDHPASRTPPNFIDYLFLSFTTSTAFSPTDTLPLTIRMKALMMLQASVSLVTIALVAARAVNILR